MRHKKIGRKFGRKKDQRRALFKGLSRAFFMNGKISTTEAKAKEVRPLIEKMITRAKNSSLANQRMLISASSYKTAQKSAEMAIIASKRPGGYTRIVKLGPRKSDGAKMAILELVK